jgi:NCS1 family nucleobase:cation symporter-1
VDTLCLLWLFPAETNTMGGVSDLLKRLEVKPNDDEYETIETSRWGNRDVYPVAHDKRTYGVYAYVSYWGEYLQRL